MADPFEEAHLTQEVVTQYYRSPELLMEATRYSYAVDIWSVGCTFAELLGRRILFPARSPLEQLELILNLTGSPAPEDLKHCNRDACCFVLSSRPRMPHPNILYDLSIDVTEMAVHLLSSMLKFNPGQRISAADALNHPYLEEARLRYHSCMCTCCHDVPTASSSTVFNASSSSVMEAVSSPSPSSVSSSDSSVGVPSRTPYSTRSATPHTAASGTNTSPSGPSRRRYCHDLDPSCPLVLPLDLDAGFRRLSDAKKVLWESIQEYYRCDSRASRVVLNRNAANFNAFISSSVAQAKEAPASHRWH